jgi:hypothetical protein
MRTRKSKLIQNANLFCEQRYITNKFLKEDESENGELPEFQVTPVGIGKYKIKFTWEKKGVDIPTDVRDHDLFNSEDFKELCKEFVDMEEAEKLINDFKNTKQYLFKKL